MTVLVSRRIARPPIAQSDHRAPTAHSSTPRMAAIRKIRLRRPLPNGHNAIPSYAALLLCADRISGRFPRKRLPS